MSLGRNVLLFHAGALGDFILTWPIGVALARLHPQSRIFYVTHGGKGKLAEKALGVDSVDIDVGWHPLHGDAEQLNPSNLKLLRDAHTIISFVSDGRDAWARNVSRIAPEATLLCVQAPPRGQIADCIHVSDFFLRQFERHAAMHTAVQQIMRSIAERGVGGRSQADGRILIHAGAGARTKCWPLDQFISLANRLIVAGRKVQFILGETEIEKWPKTDADRLADTAPLQTPSDLVALYQTIRSTSCFIGNDSGPGHLAGIVGVPTVIAFGAGDPNSWKPLGPAVAAVKSGRVDDMYAAVAELLGSVP